MEEKQHLWTSLDSTSKIDSDSSPTYHSFHAHMLVLLNCSKRMSGPKGHHDICAVSRVCTQKSRQGGEQSNVISLCERRPCDGRGWGECLELRPCRRGRISWSVFHMRQCPSISKHAFCSFENLHTHCRIMVIPRHANHQAIFLSWFCLDCHCITRAFKKLNLM